MKPQRTQKRSVSPFGYGPATIDDPFAQLRERLSALFPVPSENAKSQLKIIEDACFLPEWIEKISDAPANDAPGLDTLCQFILRYRETFRERGLEDILFETMKQLFDRKTELFMVDHQDRAQCERMGWSADYRDLVLFSKERDALVGRFFAPFTEMQPGLFSEFVNRWIESENPDRILHFLDFCTGSKNPTFEHYLLFSHPALARVVTNKAQLKALFEKTKPLVSKLSSPTWEHDARLALSV